MASGRPAAASRGYIAVTAANHPLTRAMGPPLTTIPPTIHAATHRATKPRLWSGPGWLPWRPRPGQDHCSIPLSGAWFLPFRLPLSSCHPPPAVARRPQRRGCFSRQNARSVPVEKEPLYRERVDPRPGRTCQNGTLNCHFDNAPLPPHTSSSYFSILRYRVRRPMPRILAALTFSPRVAFRVSMIAFRSSSCRRPSVELSSTPGAL